jgi:hypothetical protein
MKIKFSDILYKILFTFLLVLPYTFVKAEVWDGYNNPSRFDIGHHYLYGLNELPTQSQLAALPWSETYWPSNKGSINVRWNTAVPDGFNYTPPTYVQAKQMTLEQLTHLSPSEKYDLYRGDYSYSLWREVKQHANPMASEWVGMCDGWSIASIQYAEPNSVTLMNPDGILIPFGSSDVKGLMSYAAEFHFSRNTVQVGRKCTTANPQNPTQTEACADVNAGALHVILSNQIGIDKTPFITERDPGTPIWQQPTFGYEFHLLGSAPSGVAGAHGEEVHAILYYTDDPNESYWNPVLGTPEFHSNQITMDYILDLDKNERIVGGSWMPGSDHPDYVWLPLNHLVFSGIMTDVQKVYQAAL